MPFVSSFVTLPAPTRTSLVIFDTRPDATYELRATLLRPTTSLESDSGQCTVAHLWQWPVLFGSVTEII